MSECKEARDFVKLQFTGGQSKKGRARGPFRSYETGGIYVLLRRYANKKAYPYFKLVSEEVTCDEIPEPWRTRLGLDKDKIEKIAEKYGISLEQAKELMDDLKPKTEIKIEEVEEEVEEFDVTGASDEVIETSSMSANPTGEQMIRGMDLVTLRGYISGQGGEWNKHWSRDRLIKEALTLQ